MCFADFGECPASTKFRGCVVLDRAYFTKPSMGAAFCFLDVDLPKSKFGDLLEELGGERSTYRYPCLAESHWQHIFPVLEKQGKVKGRTIGPGEL